LAQLPTAPLPPVYGGRSWSVNGFPACRIDERHVKQLRCYVYGRSGDSSTSVDAMKRAFAVQKAQIVAAAPAYRQGMEACQRHGVTGLRARFTRTGGYPLIVLIGTARAGEADVILTVSPPGVPASLPPEPPAPPCS
jgi:hypothetical protein